MIVNHTHEDRYVLLSRYDMDSQHIEIVFAERLAHFQGEFFHIMQCTYSPNNLIDDIIAPFYSMIDNPMPSKIVSFQFCDDDNKSKRRVSLTTQQAREFVQTLERLLLALQADQRMQSSEHASYTIH